MVGGPAVTAGKLLDPVYVTEYVALVEAGCANLTRHVKNTKAYGVNVVVAVNRFSTDTDAEIEAVRSATLAAGAYNTVLCTYHAHGGKGAFKRPVKLLRSLLTTCMLWMQALKRYHMVPVVLNTLNRQ